MVINETCRVGLFFQSQNTDYPNHRHAAEELYLVVSGNALWSNESDTTPREKPPGEFRASVGHVVLDRGYCV